MAQLAEPKTATALEVMWAAGLTEIEILHLIGLKHNVTAGQRSDLTPEHKRLQFARYLYRQGIIHERWSRDGWSREPIPEMRSMPGPLYQYLADDHARLGAFLQQAAAQPARAPSLRKAACT